MLLHAAAIACLAGASASAPEPSLSLDRERQVAERVSRQEALQLVIDLVALGPRMGGTGSGDRAARLMAKRFTDLGLTVEVIEDPPRLVHEEASWAVELRGERLASAWPYGYSPSHPRASLTLVSDEAPEAAWKGAAIVTSRSAREMYRRAVKAGGGALLTDHPSDPNRYVAWAFIDELPHDETALPPIPAFGLSHDDGRRLRAAIGASGDDGRRLRAAIGASGGADAAVTIALEASRREGRPLTVLATLPGAGVSKDDVILIGAHGDSDSGGPGADDNASGVAALREVARALAWAASRGWLPPDRPQVRFAVWGTEVHSSRAYVAARTSELARHRAALNFDQAGLGSARDAIYYEGNDVPWNETLLRTLEKTASDHAGRDGFWTVHTSNPALGGTDAYVFLPPRHHGVAPLTEKIPSTTIFTSAWGEPTVIDQTRGWESPGWPEKGRLFIDYSAYYHSSGDRPEVTTHAEPFNMERCARLAALGVMRLMALPAGKSSSPR